MVRINLTDLSDQFDKLKAIGYDLLEPAYRQVGVLVGGRN